MLLDQLPLPSQKKRPCRLCLGTVLLIITLVYGLVSYAEWRPSLPLEELEDLIVRGDVKRVQILDTRADVYLTDAAVFSGRHPDVTIYTMEGMVVGPHYYTEVAERFVFVQRIEAAAAQAPRTVWWEVVASSRLLTFLFGIFPIGLAVSVLVWGICFWAIKHHSTSL